MCRPSTCTEVRCSGSTRDVRVPIKIAVSTLVASASFSGIKALRPTTFMLIDSLQSGTVIDGRYVLTGRIGDGGMGAVFSCTEIGLERFLALKFLHPELLVDEDNRQRFQLEGKILSDLAHPNILTVYRFGIWSTGTSTGEPLPVPYIVMELLKGRTLRSLLDERGAMPPLQCAEIILQVCEAMSCAHAKGFVHRDMKPDNLMMIENKGEPFVKILDFGLARVLPEANIAQHLTQTGTLLGTAAYMSPEQCLGRKADHRSDIYSLGCTFYEVLTATPPHTADNPIGLMHKHATEAPQPVVAMGNNIPVCFDRVLQRAMAKNAEERYQSMSEFGDDLRKILSGQQDQIAPSVQPRARVSRVSTTAKILILLVLVMAGTTVYLFCTKQSGVQDKRETEATLLTSSLKLMLHRCHKMPSGPQRDELVLKLVDMNNRTPALTVDQVMSVYLTAAQLHCARGDFDKASKCVEQARVLVSGKYKTGSSQCMALLQMQSGFVKQRSGDYSGAIKDYKAGVELVQGTDYAPEVTAHCALADLYMFTGEFASARGEALMALSMESRHQHIMREKAIAVLGRCLFKLGKKDEALRLYANAFKTLSRKDADRLYSCIFEPIDHYEENELLSCYDDLTSLIDSVRPDLSQTVHGRRAHVFINCRRLKAAEVELRRFVPDPTKASPQHFMRYQYLLSKLRFAQRDRGAKLLLQKTIKLYEKDPFIRCELLLYLGVLTADLRQSEESKRYFDEFHRLLPEAYRDMPDALTGLLTQVALYCDSPARSAEVLHRSYEALSDAQWNPKETFLLLAEVEAKYLLLMNEHELVEELLQDAMRRCPAAHINAKETWMRVNQLLVKEQLMSGQYEKARQTWCERDAGVPGQFLNFLVTLADKGELSKSEKMLEYAVERYRGEPRQFLLANMGLAGCHQRMQKYSLAIERIEKLRDQISSLQRNDRSDAHLLYMFEMVQGVSRLYSGHERESLKNFDEAGRIAKQYPKEFNLAVGCYYAAHACELLKLDEHAQKYLAEARLVCGPNDTEYRFQHAMFNVRRGSKQSALAELGALFNEQKKLHFGYVNGGDIVRQVCDLDPSNRSYLIREAKAALKPGVTSAQARDFIEKLK